MLEEQKEKKIKQNKVVRNVISGICLCASILFAIKGSLLAISFGFLMLYLDNRYR